MGAWLCRDELGDSIPRNPAIDCTRVIESKKPIICLIGGPGAGKTTLGKRLAAKYGFTPIIVSELLRIEANSGTERGHIMKKIMQEGRNLPADVITQKIEEKIMANATAPGYLLIGFPRDTKQLSQFRREVKLPDLCVYLWARRQVLEERMRSRAMIAERFDDTDLTIVSRIKTFFKDIRAVLRALSKILVSIDAEKSDVEVFAVVCQAIDNAIAQIPQ